VWEPTIGEVSSCEREIRKSHDTFVVVIKAALQSVMMHVPRILN